MSNSKTYEIAAKAMKESFTYFDTDKSGFIELHELRLLLTKWTDSFHVEDPLDSDVVEIFNELDINGDKKISQG